MNIFLLSLDTSTEYNFYFLDTKPNVIMEGIFTKIIFTHSCFTLNGVYFSFPILHQSIETTVQKQDYIYFEPAQKLNIPIIKQCKHMEKSVLQAYMDYRGNVSKKVPIYSVAKQLNSGKCRIQLRNNHKTDNIMRPLIIKLSGIWETANEYGLTYKIIESSE